MNHPPAKFYFGWFRVGPGQPWQRISAYGPDEAAVRRELRDHWQAYGGKDGSRCCLPEGMEPAPNVWEGKE